MRSESILLAVCIFPCLAIQVRGEDEAHPPTESEADPLITAGQKHLSDGRYNKSIACFEKFLRNFPDHEQAEKVQFKIGLCLALLEDFVRAGRHFEAFAQKRPGSRLAEMALFWCGDTFLKADKVERSRKAFEACIKRNPDGKWAKLSRDRLAASAFDKK